MILSSFPEWFFSRFGEINKSLFWVLSKLFFKFIFSWLSHRYHIDSKPSRCTSSPVGKIKIFYFYQFLFCLAGWKFSTYLNNNGQTRGESRSKSKYLLLLICLCLRTKNCMFTLSLKKKHPLTYNLTKLKWRHFLIKD